MDVCIKFFGNFRSVGVEEHVSVPDGAIVQDVKAALIEKIGHEMLVKESALATDSQVLLDADVIPIGETISILPPVCGG